MARVVLYMVCILPYLVALCTALPGLRRVLYTCVARGSARCAERHLFTTAALGWRGHRTAAAVPSGQRVCCPAADAAVAAVDWVGVAAGLIISASSRCTVYRFFVCRVFCPTGLLYAGLALLCVWSAVPGLCSPLQHQTA